MPASICVYGTENGWGVGNVPGRTFGIAQLTAIFGDALLLPELKSTQEQTICIRSHDLGNLLYDPSLDFGLGPAMLSGPIAKIQGPGCPRTCEKFSQA